MAKATKEERALFDEAKKLLDKSDFAMRSCWNCNPAHEHLKEASYLITCFECGQWFYRGQNLTEIGAKVKEDDESAAS